MPNFGDLFKRIKIIIESEEVEILVRRANTARKVLKFCRWCKDHLDHAQHHDDDQNSYYLCTSCDTPN
jgi:predicted SprT family Zn-dependent metalloprotease